MDYQSSLVFLNSLTNFEFKLGQLGQKDFSLDSFRQFLEHIGNPQDALQYVHIAGSKGKGSTALFTAEMLKEAGYRVGLYTSPHLYDVRERIRVFDKTSRRDSGDLFAGCISETAFTIIAGHLKEVLENSCDGRLTYFEFLTALAFLHFQNERVDIVVLETGLGGRLDSTNVIQPLVCGISLIDFDHTGILGDALGQIASEKAGIIKKGCRRVVCGLQKPEAKKVIEDRCRECRSVLLSIGKEISIEDVVYDDGMRFNVRCFENVYQCRTRLLGKFQTVNAAVAIGLIHALNQEGFSIPEKAVEKAVAEAVWPARMEIVCDDPLVVVDGAHTAASARSAAETIQECFSDRKIILIFGMNSDKDWYGFIQYFVGIVAGVIVTRSSHERANTFSDGKVDDVLFAQGVDVVREDSVKRAFQTAIQKCGSQDMILASGSLFLAAEVRHIVLNREFEKRPLGEQDE